MRAASPAMSWFRITDGCLRFGGRVTKGPVREWLDTADGSMATDRYFSVVTAGRISGAVQRVVNWTAGLKR